MLLLGAHMSIAGGVENAFARGEKVGCTAMQIFTKNASQWKAKPLTDRDVRAFKDAWEKSPIGPVVAHDSYLINLAAPEDDKWHKAIAAFLDEMERCAALGIGDLVMHPGAHMGAGEQAGLQRIVQALRKILEHGPETVKVLLENTAGQGTYIGSRFDHLAVILEALGRQDRFGVCFDTCHAFAAGYDLSHAEGYQKVMDDFDRVVGLEKIGLFHLNDCKKGLGSHVDRHDHIGLGQIGEEGFRALMRDERFAAVPKILETPKGDDDEWDLKNLALLRRLAWEE